MAPTPGRVRLRNTPFFVPGLSLGDIVFTARRKGVLKYAGVSLRGGHSTYWLATCTGDAWKARWTAEGARLLVRGHPARPGRVGLAVDVPPHARIEEVLALLEGGTAAGAWDYEEGHRGHP